MQLFYTPDIKPPHHALTEEESRHCVKVLRMQPGDRLHLTDGRGEMYEGVITKADSRRCEVEIVETIHEYGKRSYSLSVAIAPTKNIDRFEWFLEKATEVGIDSIVPIMCQNSERRTIKPERVNKVVTSAVKQSLKAYHPRIEPLTDIRELIGRPFDGVKLIAHCRAQGSRVALTEAIRKNTDTVILIGPEGDFTVEEIAWARENGFTEISLGQSRLRTETAAVAAVMAVYFINLT